MPLGVDNSWSEADFDSGFSISIAEAQKGASPHDLEFDIKGIDPSVANALRRILISDVPTVAIEHVFFVNNTSIIADEVLAHRLGLVPMNIDPRCLDFKSAQVGPSEKNTVVFRMRVDCKWKAGMGGEIVNDKVLSRHLEYLPCGSEMPEETGTRFGGSQAGVLPAGAAACEEDVLLAKMRPGQSIDLEAHCIKGVGSEHAKWSPVATAWYRLHPELLIIQPITGAMADEIVQLCSHPAKGDLFRMEGSGEGRHAVVTSARGNEHHLEKVRRLLGEERWKGHLNLRKRKDHFIFTIQSTGALPPEELFLQSIDILSAKCDKLLEQL